MNNRDLVTKYKTSLPGYKVVGYTEVGVPMFRVNVKCLVQKAGRLPIVQEYILNLWSEQVEIEDIIRILALDREVIVTAFAQLMQFGYIDTMTKRITEIGNDYLSKHALSNLEEEEYMVYVDGLTKNIISSTRKYMSSKNVKENEIRTIRSLIKKVQPEDIKFSQLKKEIQRQKETKENEIIQDDECDSQKDVELIDIISTSKAVTFYKKVSLIVFKNYQDDIRIFVFDGYKQVDLYEEPLLELDTQLVRILDYRINENLLYQAQDDEESFVETDKNINYLDTFEIRKHIERCFTEAKQDIFIVISLTSMTQFDEELLMEIKQSLKKKIRVTIFITGKEAVNDIQKIRIMKLIKLKKEFRNLVIVTIPQYYNEMVGKDNDCGVLIKLIKHQCNLNMTQYGVVEEGEELGKEQIERLKQELLESKEEVDGIISQVELFKKIEEMHSIIEKIFRMAIDIDQYMFSDNQIGWFYKQAANYDEIKKISFADDKSKFKIFTDIMNANLVEQLESNFSKRLSDRGFTYKKIKGYFYNEFKQQYSDLQYVLNKLRVYRNKQSHKELNPSGKIEYDKFLQEDLGGCDPEFLDNGYLILQSKLLHDLYTGIYNTLRDLRK